MNPETMSPEEIKRLEISRAKSDEELLDTGAKYSTMAADQEPRLDLNPSKHDLQGNLHAEGERKIASIEQLESKEFKSDLKNLKDQILQEATSYRAVRDGMRSELQALREVRKNLDPADLVNSIKNNDYSIYQWQRSVLLIRKAEEIIKKYGLRVPVFESMQPDEIITGLPADEIATLIEQARSQALLESKEHLGKVQ